MIPNLRQKVQDQVMQKLLRKTVHIVEARKKADESESNVEESSMAATESENSQTKDFVSFLITAYICYLYRLHFYLQDFFVIYKE